MDSKIQRITEHSTQSEKAIERYLVGKVKALGGYCLKYSNPWATGYPDRVCLLPWGKTIWIELKSKGADRTRQQKHRCWQLDNIGHVVHVCDSKDAVDAVLRDYGYEI